MDLVIAQSCPSCGAEISLAEDDRLVRCPYCDVYNYRVAGSAPRYLLPGRLPAGVDPAAVVHIPYLRFKGTVYEVGGEGVHHRIVDTTRLGIEENDLPPSLGLRPQAMRLLPLIASRPGSYLRQSVPREEAFNQAVAVAGLLRRRERRSLFHRAFIGETLSRIYQPCYLHGDTVFDGVVARPLGSGELFSRHHSVAADPAWEPRFISSHCPRCSGGMDGERDTLVLRCRGCRSEWQEEGGRFVPVSSTMVPTTIRDALHLPFWRVTIATEGVRLTGFGDYLRFTNQPIAVRPAFDSLPLCLWVPAFKLNPRSFLQLAAQLTLGQWRLPAAEEGFVDEAYGVNLPAREAVQAVKTVLAHTTVSKKTSLPLLAELRIARHETRLIYVPFIVRGLDYVEEHSGAALLAAALRFGKTL